MQLTLLTPHRKLVENVSADEVIAPGFSGILDMLEGHANFVTPLETGIIKWKSGGAWSTATISYGILEVSHGNMSIMADVSEMSTEIDVGRAKKAFEVSKKKIDEGGLDQNDFKKFELKMKRAMARMSAGGGQ